MEFTRNSPPASFDLLPWLSHETRAALDAEMVHRRYKAGQLIYAQNDPGAELYRVVDGAVRASRLRKSGRHLVYCYFGPGDVFGESGLIDGSPRGLTAEAKIDTEVEVLGAAAFNRLRSVHRDIDTALLHVVTWKMRMLSQQVAHAALDDISSRVAAKILENARGFSRPVTVVQQGLALSQSDLASMLGLSRQSVSKVLQRFQQDGVITIEYGRIEIIDLPALETTVANMMD